MNPWKWLCLILLAVALALGAALAIAHFRLAAADEVVERYVAGELTRQGYVPGEYKKPAIPDAPPGSTPLVRVGGTARYPPIRRSQGSPTPGPTTSPAHEAAHLPEVEDGAPPTPCSLDDLDVTVDCLAEVMAETSRPWARITSSGQIAGWGQVRVLEPVRAADVHLEVAPAAALPTWRLDLLAGLALGSRQGVEFGASWTGRTRLGGYLLAEWQPATTGSVTYSETTIPIGEPATWRLHGGVRVRLK